jgi:DNA replication and repair protein RecF
MNYQRVLLQRNSLIKQMAEQHIWEEGTVAIYDIQLVKYGEEVYRVRKQFIEDFMPVFYESYRMITDGVEEVSLVLVSQLDHKDFNQLLKENRSKDKALHYTTVGIHKDDLDFTIQGRSMKKFGSQGQQKSFLTSLKLAEQHYLKAQLDISPILMLDDVFDKLDEHRVKRLIKNISSNGFGQVFITDTSADKLKQLFSELGVEANFHDI